MSRLMRGKQTMESDTALAIAKALGCEPTDFADKYVKASDE
jgi:hypothetical protein